MNPARHGMSLLVCLLFVVGNLQAEISESTARKLIDISGMKLQVEAFPGIISTGIEQSLANLSAPPSDIARLSIKRKIASFVEPAIILRTVEQSLMQELNDTEADELIGWYTSELGRRITKAEVAASRATAIDEMLRKSDSLMLSETRVDYARQIDQLSGATSSTLELQDYVAKSIYQAVVAQLDPKKNGDIEDFLTELDVSRSARREQITKFNTLGHVYAYKKFEVASVREYLDFIASAASQKYISVARTTLMTELKSAIDKIAEWSAGMVLEQRAPASGMEAKE